MMPTAAHLDAVILVCRALLHHLVPKLDLLYMSHFASECFRDALVDGLCGSHRELPGRVVIADRFTDATMAYQGYGRGLGPETVKAIDVVACQGTQPDLTLWLDIDPEVGVRRALSRESAIDESRMEREALDFRIKVRDGYERIHRAEPDRVKRIDASGTVDEVFQAVKSEVERAL